MITQLCLDDSFENICVMNTRRVTVDEVANNMQFLHSSANEGIQS